MVLVLNLAARVRYDSSLEFSEFSAGGMHAAYCSMHHLRESYIYIKVISCGIHDGKY
jgi:hypothetical protein